MINVPNRNVLAIVSHNDQRAIKFFEDLADAVNNPDAGNTRPDTPTLGQQFYDTTISRPIWWDGTIWRDAAGLAV